MENSDSWQDVPEDSGEIEMSDKWQRPGADFLSGMRQMELLGLVDIGVLGSWSVSSFKQGSGIKELREDTPHSFWQSDGPQPHHLDIHFSKKVTISRISIYTDYSQDESYTPSKIVFLSGTGFHDLIEVTTIDLTRPIGWTHIILEQPSTSQSGLKTFLIRLMIISNHQHGKDTHLRSVKIYSKSTTCSMDTSVLGSFTSRKLLAESLIR